MFCALRRQAIGEAARPSRRVAREELLPGERGERRREVVRHPLGAQVRQHGEVHRATGIGEAAADRFPALGNRVDRAAEVLGAVHPVVLGDVHLDVIRLFRAPEERAAGHVGMEGSNEDSHASKRNARGDQALVQAGDECLGGRSTARAVVEPLEDRPQVYRFVNHRLDSTAPGTSGRRSSTPESSCVVERLVIWWLENACA